MTFDWRLSTGLDAAISRRLRSLGRVKQVCDDWLCGNPSVNIYIKHQYVTVVNPYCVSADPYPALLTTTLCLTACFPGQPE